MLIHNTIMSFTTTSYLYVVKFISNPARPETDKMCDIICDEYHYIDNVYRIADYEEDLSEKPADFDKGYVEILKVTARDIDEIGMWQNGERIYF